MTTNADIKIEVWADVLCPCCYIGEKRIETAIEQFEHKDNVKLKVRTFQLNPAASKQVKPTLEFLSEKYGVSGNQARDMERQMALKAGNEGLKYELNRPQSGTFDMLRLVHLGNEYGVGWNYLRAMQAEVFSGNFQAFEAHTLVQIGEHFGIPADEIQDVLATDRYTDAVKADHEEAVNLGASGVPFTVVGGRIGIPGAIESQEYVQILDRFWGEINNGK